MAEQFLDGAEIRAVAQEVGGEAVAKGVGCCGLGKPQYLANGLDMAAHQGRLQPLAAKADEER